LGLLLVPGLIDAIPEDELRDNADLVQGPLDHWVEEEVRQQHHYHRHVRLHEGILVVFDHLGEELGRAVLGDLYPVGVSHTEAYLGGGCLEDVVEVVGVVVVIVIVDYGPLLLLQVDWLQDELCESELAGDILVLAGLEVAPVDELREPHGPGHQGEGLLVDRDPPLLQLFVLRHLPYHL